MKVLVLGASGATGKLVVLQLLKRNIQTRILVRETAVIPVEISQSKNIEIRKGNIDDFDIAQITELVKNCDHIVCCLGHNITLKGLFGHPRRLVFNAICKIAGAILDCGLNKKLILMSTTAYTNKKQDEKNTLGEKIVFSLLKILLPPHKDNMLAGDYLIYKIGTEKGIEWVEVRPDSLFDEQTESEYNIYPTKTRSPIFNPGKTSRINVSHFMVNLIITEKLWEEWKYRTPVIYNRE